MLVLKRKIEESITIADIIRIKILSIAGENVNVGVDAPRELKVMRTENLHETKENGKPAAGKGKKEGRNGGGTVGER